jgi:hypothetical protein
MPPLPKATCPRCKKLVPLRRNGALREHNNTSGTFCPASGDQPSIEGDNK